MQLLHVGLRRSRRDGTNHVWRRLATHALQCCNAMPPLAVRREGGRVLRGDSAPCDPIGIYPRPAHRWGSLGAVQQRSDTPEGRKGVACCSRGRSLQRRKFIASMIALGRDPTWRTGLSWLPEGTGAASTADIIIH